ncbi:xaa-Pro aminopeptidase 1-like isoform X1 [Lytechinus variegatus]|uniref:xaa-Pro aminopeptidase 1-like isoform X1 n=1 Tax=Lytechinus variegatus TaxID=7654 RepID=UPI001BB25D3E|nr:xaa-Pro aminopeptidase 1-like isoform X1 [Lytechinus variegatus]
MKSLLISLCCILVLSSCLAEPIAMYDADEVPLVHGRGKSRERRDAGDTERDCSSTPPYHPDTAVNTTEQLAKIREYMVTYNYDAYIVPSEDAHGSEYIAAPDERRPYISGFSGSAGLAVITTDHAAVWTDGRYFIQGERELWCDWILMKSGQPGVPSTAEWLASTSTDPTMGANLPEGAMIGYDPRLMSISTVQSYLSTLESSGRNLTMVGNVEQNLVDLTWNDLDEQPGYPDKPLIFLGIQYTGESWEDKITEVRKQMEAAEATKLILPKLDEVAWLFNMRGEDIPYNPMFIAYAVVGLNDVTLYAYDKVGRIDASTDIKTHLKIDTCESVCITVKDYDQFATELPSLNDDANAKIWFSDVSNYFIYTSISQDKAYIEASPVLLTKAQKNPTEVEGMKEAHRLDSISLCELGGWLQETMDSLEDPAVGDKSILSELVVEDMAKEFRSVHESNKGLSFGTISSFGPNGAVIHYSSSNETDVPITNQGIFLLDSGGQYLEGTCDITRSFHFGEPTDFMKEAYTRVLMGHIDLVSATFRTGVYGREIDAHARQPLWEGGLDYRHGTGHGIGHFLNVHEGPASISLGYSSRHKPISVGMFFSDEPGYYEDGEFGIRIENVMFAKEATTQHKFNDYTYMTFEMISLVPFEPTLIDFSLMTMKQIEWYNAYNERIKNEIKPSLTTRGKEWVEMKTKYVDPSTGAAAPLVTSFICVIMTSLIAMFLQ